MERKMKDVISEYNEKISEYKIKILATMISAGLFVGASWQLEVIHLREVIGHPFSLPFFIATGFNYVHWKLVWLSVMVLSYVLFFMYTQFSWKERKIIEGKMYLMVVSLLIFAVGMWQLGDMVIDYEQYVVPFFNIETRPPFEFNGGELINPILESSFWGDFWVLVIILSYALIFYRIL